jgi:predicted ATP-dependent endonuclease of OLD family
MELKSLTLKGFRRFAQKTKLSLEGKLVALVGSNEAGKTSLLQAVLAHQSGGFATTDHSYSAPGTVEITLSYFLSQEDAEFAGIDRPTWFHVTRRQDGQLTGKLDRFPSRDTSNRAHCAAALAAAREAVGQHDDSNLARLWSDKLVGELDALLVERLDKYEGKELQRLEGLKLEIESSDFKKLPSLAEPLGALKEALSELLAFERQHDPHRDAVQKLLPLRPKILEFTQEYRDLQIPYNIRLKNAEKKEQQKRPAKPLQELMDLVGLNLDDLIRADLQNNRAVREGLLAEANERLRTLWKGRWSQSNAYPRFDLERSHLDILIVQEGFETRHQFNNYSERSAGYKQFIALQIFALLKEINRAILLVDELEQHLHYDAQADVVQMLTAEDRIGKVIYATHSAGCLPEDLGSGVKLVQWKADDPKQSVVVNRFWALDNSGGFAPLLFGMGATTMSFLPTRRAVIGEGATEMLLLPRMLREVTGRDRLGFQVLHGLSNFSPTGIPVVDRQVSKVAFITDNDAGGQALRRSLQQAGVSLQRIFAIGDPTRVVTVEDLVDETIWLTAINDIGAKLHSPEQFDSAPTLGRIASLPEGLRTRKIDIAYAILDASNKQPDLRISDARHHDQLRKLVEDIEVSF